MLEKACVTVESAAKGGGVCPEVLFDVARQWFSLYQKVSQCHWNFEIYFTLNYCFFSAFATGYGRLE